MKSWSKFSSLTVLSAHALIAVHTLYTLCRPWKCVCKKRYDLSCVYTSTHTTISSVVSLECYYTTNHNNDTEIFSQNVPFYWERMKILDCRGGAVKMNNQRSNYQTSLIRVLDIILGLWSYRKWDGFVWHLLDRLPVSCDIYF